MIMQGEIVPTGTHISGGTTSVLDGRSQAGGETEVGQEEVVTLFIREDVLGFQVAMEDASLVAGLDGVDESDEGFAETLVVVSVVEVADTAVEVTT